MNNGWENLNLSAESLELIRREGFLEPTPVQQKCIPIALKGQDLIGTAQTGTGKTATFTLPMVERFAGRKGTYGLVLAPTREIAQQTQATFDKFGKPRGVESIVLIGGVNMKDDDKALASYPQVIVATPGRLCDHLDRGNIWLDFIEVVVLDEADRMLDMGFTDQLSRIMQDVPASRQTLLFSATMTPSVEKLARKIMKDPARIAIGAPQSTAATVEQFVRHISEDQKNAELRRIIREESGSIIVFTRSKIGATRVWRSLHSSGVYDATYIHSDRLQSHREQALAEFKEGKYRILIATDVAGRGIHVENVAHVVNYDLPMEPEDYVHRIGRTGRAGATGRATTFITPRDRAAVKLIEKLTGQSLSDAPTGPGMSDESTPLEENSSVPSNPPRLKVRLKERPNLGEKSKLVSSRSKPKGGGLQTGRPAAVVTPAEDQPVPKGDDGARIEASYDARDSGPMDDLSARDWDRFRNQKTYFPIDAPPPPPLSARGLYAGTATPWSTKSATPWREEAAGGGLAPRLAILGAVEPVSESRGRRRRRGARVRGPASGETDALGNAFEKS